MADWSRGLSLNRFMGYPDTDEGSVPNTPFPGVAPVDTIRIHRDDRYDRGLDMMDQNPDYQGCAPTHTSLVDANGKLIGANGKLGVDPGRPKTGGPKPMPEWDVMPPVRKRRRGK